MCVCGVVILKGRPYHKQKTILTIQMIARFIRLHVTNNNSTVLTYEILQQSGGLSYLINIWKHSQNNCFKVRSSFRWSHCEDGRLRCRKIKLVKNILVREKIFDRAMNPGYKVAIVLLYLFPTQFHNNDQHCNFIAVTWCKCQVQSTLKSWLYISLRMKITTELCFLALKSFHCFIPVWLKD